jgi:hypothetical protein
MTEPAKQAVKPEQSLFPVRLLRHYVPKGEYKIAGYNKPPIEQKNAIGQMVMIDPGGWQEGEMHPAPLPGAGFPRKIWADTVVQLPVDEAKEVVAKKIGERADALP